MSTHPGFGNIERQVFLAGIIVYIVVVAPMLLNEWADVSGVMRGVLVLKYTWPLLALPLVALGVYWRERKAESDASWEWDGYKLSLYHTATFVCMSSLFLGFLWGLWSLL